ncbi:Yip1-domain-containing protein [Basidiobolus meristosporus CBS 931.73]|uniref:Protein YIP n=1 Tax=Basidiobolus meristosporus CBS 931.73 TaxID=1314790 RepID=A0A1Y1XXB0_9FUNG|nr:Yip1-domain-containing protein [Basidiobolus meristosporus CBS 931.73]|eukprot:ORX89964.1 Yip1-domain-containing protein [Basidiobolus meristosporus CBS 931.73]
MIQSLVPFKTNFLEVIGDNPDLYGPFWVATTVIFTMFITSSLAESIAAYINDKPHAYDFISLWFATVTIYLYVLFGSLLVWGATKYFGCQPALLEVANIYGYGMTVWIPVSILSVIPSNILRWICTIVGFLISGYFLTKNLYHIILRSTAKTPRLLVIGILISHFIVACIFKVKFFSYDINLGVLPDAGKNIADIGN